MNKSVRVVGSGLAALAVVGAGIAFGWHWWTTGRYFESTDDAYLKADYTVVAPKVSGYIATVGVADNQHVEAGDVVAVIDDRDFRTALAKAQADVAAAEASIDNIRAQLGLQQSVIAQSDADINAAVAAHAFAEKDYARYGDLLRKGFITAQTTQKAEADLREKRAALDHDRHARAAALREVDVLKSTYVKATTERDRALQAQQQARTDLGYTLIRAPIAGTVGARAVRIGQFVQAGSQLMAVVPLEEVYVVANFKETQLAHIRPGQPVRIEVDGLPDVDVHGLVDSVSPASGLEFALLAPDNATGNFTKIVQRVPVKIAIERNDSTLGLLRSGMSVTPIVDTRSEAKAQQRSALADAPSLSTAAR